MLETSGRVAPSTASDARAQVLLAHGGGGRLMHELIEQVFYPAFENPFLAQRHDGARLDLRAAGLSAIDPAHSAFAFTTDAYVVRPLFFPGGDIGALAIHGTVNDLAMCGARPLYLSAAFILEEGLAVELLARVAASMRVAAQAAGALLVTGDTKVVERGKGDGLYVTTAGIGLIDGARVIAPSSVRAGDAVIVSGDIGRHGVAILAAREELALESAIESDCADLSRPVRALLDAGCEIHCLRDCTRGGFATSLIEIASEARATIAIDETAVPVHETVRGACELLGFDPLYVANEGRFVCLLPEAQAQQALAILREHRVSSAAAIVGCVTAGAVAGAPAGIVTARGRLGVSRVLDLLSGEQLPRIC
jgi:hydrogenase expression/formation protein HypE